MAATSAGVKRALRSAVQCLQRKEYREALTHCQEALDEDPQCYEAWL